MDANELGGAKDADGSRPADMGELKSSKDTAEPKLFWGVEVKATCNGLKAKRGWSYHLKLTDERRMATKEKDKLKHEALSNLFHRIFFKKKKN